MDANRNIGGLWKWSAVDKETSRLEAFSDGVFAVAITLLILEIRVPELAESKPTATSSRSLGRLWPSFSAFVLSFFVVLLIWINHHELFRMVQRVDRLLMFANGCTPADGHLYSVSHGNAGPLFRHSRGQHRGSVLLWTFLVASVCHNLLFESVARDRRLLRADVSNREIARLRRSYHLGLAVYSLSVLVAIFSAIGGLVISGALWILWATLRYGSARGQVLKQFLQLALHNRVQQYLAVILTYYRRSTHRHD